MIDSYDAIVLVPPLSAPPEAEVMSAWTGTVPVVSVLVPVFNHRVWIDDCLNGILAQETDFPFEVLVRDDASTDGTQERLLYWRDRYPKILRLIINHKNMLSDENPIVGLLPHVRSNYLAYCEGDDYWCIPGKLQRQVQLLEESSDFSCVSHGHYVKHEESAAGYAVPGLTIRFPRGSAHPVFSVPTVSMVFRCPVSFPEQAISNAPFGDVVLKAVLASEGDILHEGGYLGAVYRVHNRGMHNELSASEANAKSVTSLIIAAHELARRDDQCGASNILTEATKQLVSFSDIYFGTRSAVAVHRATALRHRFSWSLRAKARESPWIRFLYFACRRRRDPRRTRQS